MNPQNILKVLVGEKALYIVVGELVTRTPIIPERSPSGIFFIPFPKIGRFKESMTE